MMLCFLIYKNMHILKVYSIHYTLRLNTNLKKIHSNKINGTKNAFFFLSWAPSHHSFTFNLRFLYQLKLKVRLSKTVGRIFHFQFCFDFIKVCIFVPQNVWTLWLENTIISFKIEITEKPHTGLLPILNF